MPGFVPGIHVFLVFVESKTWMAGTTPGHDERNSAAMAVKAAKDLGLANTAHIEGGIDAWKKAGGPVVSG
jgi:hypothetical protein